MGNFFKYAALTAATVLTASSFISCDKEDDKDEFVSETIKVTLHCNPDILGLGPSHSYHWQWMNCEEAAVVAIKNSNSKFDNVPIPLDSIPLDSIRLDSIRLDTIGFDQVPYTKFDSIYVFTGHDQVWEFQTKETGVRELKFNYYDVTSGIRSDTNGVHFYCNENLLRDTVIKF